MASSVAAKDRLIPVHFFATCEFDTLDVLILGNYVGDYVLHSTLLFLHQGKMPLLSLYY